MFGSIPFFGNKYAFGPELDGCAPSLRLLSQMRRAELSKGRRSASPLWLGLSLIRWFSGNKSWSPESATVTENLTEIDPVFFIRSKSTHPLFHLKVTSRV